MTEINGHICLIRQLPIIGSLASVAPTDETFTKVLGQWVAARPRAGWDHPSNLVINSNTLCVVIDIDIKTQDICLLSMQGIGWTVARCVWVMR